MARGGCFAGVFSSVNMLAVLREIFVLRLLVYVKCFSYLYGGFEERDNV